MECAAAPEIVIDGTNYGEYNDSRSRKPQTDKVAASAIVWYLLERAVDSLRYWGP
jgi:hypothetical protein